MNRAMRLEPLETRCLLDAASITPAILGTVFQDGDGNMMPSPGEVLQGVTVRLFLDDGDGTFEPGAGDTQVGAALVTDANGDYCFDGLDPDSSYFVQQPAQTVSGISLDQQVSAAQQPGSPGLLIDGFVTPQAATASPPAPSSSTAVLAFANESEVIGAERDMASFLDSGDGEVRVSINPFGSRETLRYNSDVAVSGSGVLSWDGVDIDAGTTSMGLDGRDLTDGGQHTGIVFRIGAVLPGATARIRLFEGNDLNFSEATLAIPVTTGGAADSYEFIPFGDFFGPVNANNVDAIELVLDANDSGGNDIELALIGANGPRRVNFSSTPGTDIGVSKTDNRAEAVPGESLTYTIVVTNNGPSDVVGARVTDEMPDELQAVTFTSTVTGTVSGNTTSGSGDIDDTVDMTAGSTITYTVTGTVDPAAVGTITNTVSANLPNGFIDSVPENNNAVDNDGLTPVVDLGITKTDNVDTSMPGRPVTYTITASNAGPSDVVGATIEDVFPAELNVSGWTSVATGGATGNTASGSGDISDSVNMPVGSTIEYTVNATVTSNATGSVINTASISAPNGYTDSNSANNVASDTDTLDPEVDLSITKTDNVTTVSPNDMLTYTIVVQNSGPADAIGTSVTDSMPTGLTGVTFTSSGTAGVSGNTANGAGSINDVVTIPAGGTLTYEVQATVASNASGTIDNTATVAAGNGIVDTLPSNNSAIDSDIVVPEFDLSITKDDGRETVIAGQRTTYTIRVANAGPSDVMGVTVTDSFPAELTEISYTSSATGGATGNTINGTGDINDTVDLPAGAAITYTAEATAVAGVTQSISNSTRVDAPTSLNESNTANNLATDVNTVTREADLAVTKSDNRNTVTHGDTVTYEIVVRNNGPSDVVGATLVDALEPGLINGTFTSTAADGASGNSANGSGDINEVLTLPAGSSVSYVYTATVSNSATGTIRNQAVVNSPSGVVEVNSGNNMAVDTNTVEEILRSISGFVYVDANNNGLFEADEQPIADVAMSLNGTDIAGATVNRSTTSNATGRYAFNNLRPGSYSVTQTQPPAFGSGRETAGSGSTTPVAAADNVLANIGLGANADATAFNFGELRPTISKRDLLASRYL